MEKCSKFNTKSTKVLNEWSRMKNRHRVNRSLHSRQLAWVWPIVKWLYPDTTEGHGFMGTVGVSVFASIRTIGKTTAAYINYHSLNNSYIAHVWQENLEQHVFEIRLWVSDEKLGNGNKFYIGLGVERWTWWGIDLNKSSQIKSEAVKGLVPHHPVAVRISRHNSQSKKWPITIASFAPRNS
jgi:hypothetical protein